MANTLDDVATGFPLTPIVIRGRPRPGGKESYVLLEEPGEPVLLHYTTTLVPHFRRNCPHCDAGASEPKPLWYVGGYQVGSGRLVLVELTAPCHQSAYMAARGLMRPTDLLPAFAESAAAAPQFRGLLVHISRGNFHRSPRVLRCEQRVSVAAEWTYETRRELARIWGVPVKPRLFKEA